MKQQFLKLKIHSWGLLTAAGFLAVIGSLAGFWADILDYHRSLSAQYRTGNCEY